MKKILSNSISTNCTAINKEKVKCESGYLHIVFLARMLVVGFCSLSFGNASAQCGSYGQTLDNTAVTHTNGYLLGEKYTLPVGGTLDSLGIRTNAPSSASMVIALYTDNAGVPDALITQSAATMLIGGDNVVDVPDAILSAGDYWIMKVVSADAYISAQSGAAAVYYQPLAFGPVPAALSGLSTYTDNIFSAWMVVCGCPGQFASVTGSDVSCNGGSDGAATASVSGGTAPYSYSWSPSGGNAATASGLVPGTYTVTVTDNVACQTTASITINEPSPIVGSENVTICESYTWAADGQTYTSSGTYIATLPAVNGCDSTATLNLTILQPSESDTFVVACESYHWDLTGADYTFSGLYQTALPNAIGCDSSILLHLTILHGSAGSETIVADNSFTWPTNGHTYTSSGNYQAILASSNGCDSTIILHLTIHHVVNSTQTVIACDAFQWINGATYTTSTNTPQAVLQTSSGGDSIVTLNLTIVQSPMAEVFNSGTGTLTANGGTTYQWLNCIADSLMTGATSPAFTPQVTGYYAVIVSNGSCSDTSDCVLFSNLGLKENAVLSWNVYPNPASDYVIVEFDYPEAQLKLYDASGKKLSEESIENHHTVSLSMYERGVYFLELQIPGSGSEMRRILKN